MGMWETVFRSAIAAFRCRHVSRIEYWKNNKTEAHVAEAAATHSIGSHRWLPPLRYQDQRIRDDIPDGQVTSRDLLSFSVSTASLRFAEEEEKGGESGLTLRIGLLVWQTI